MRKNRKNYIGFLLISAISLICLSGNYVEYNKKSKRIEQIVGIWTEHWSGEEDGSESDVTYVDTLKISIDTSGNLHMECVNNAHLLYDKISFKKDKLTFRMENVSDPNEQFFVHYKMKTTENKDIFSGNIVNSKNKKARVKLIRLKE